ncbi:hypothetical protein LOAG_03317 [Loa loa]|uniref:Uncharacterized protein n=1 Tax=Loa loa TaxID=7209 RepID=A0A1S0U579_LOALO|nr:hypothetical protein LOAG_03317 [Loa loa]EFO25167.1 hypothetical protein LOAG_03317 [Loa loa]
MALSNTLATLSVMISPLFVGAIVKNQLRSEWHTVFFLHQPLIYWAHLCFGFGRKPFLSVTSNFSTANCLELKEADVIEQCRLKIDTAITNICYELLSLQ